jgi:hypothetical protein
MAVDDSGKQATLFPCLAILRYTVATVVTVLAVVVIVMVIAVGVRPEDVSVSVVQGHVSTSDLWNETTTYVDAETTVTPKAIYPRGGPRGSCIGGRGGPYSAALTRPCFGPGGTDDNFGTYGRPLTRTVYTPVDALSLEVALSVENQGGRGSIYCRSINVTFRAGGSTSTSMAAGMEIGVLYLPPSFDFQAKPQTSHKISREVTFRGTNVLKYIADTYGGESSFTGVVEVTINTSSVVFGHHTSPKIVTLVCSPVDFSVRDATATATSVQCIKSN